MPEHIRDYKGYHVRLEDYVIKLLDPHYAKVCQIEICGDHYSHPNKVSEVAYYDIQLPNIDVTIWEDQIVIRTNFKDSIYKYYSYDRCLDSEYIHEKLGDSILNKILTENFTNEFSLKHIPIWLLDFAIMAAKLSEKLNKEMNDSLINSLFNSSIIGKTIKDGFILMETDSILLNDIELPEKLYECTRKSKNRFAYDNSYMFRAKVKNEIMLIAEDLAFDLFDSFVDELIAESSS